MTRELPEWHGRTDDTPAPARVRLRKFLFAAGRCQFCTRKIGPGEKWHLDHRVALINGGSNREGNLQVLCEWCHADKTRDDVAEKATTARKRKASVGIKKPRTITRWRKFDGTIVTAGRAR